MDPPKHPAAHTRPRQPGDRARRHGRADHHEDRIHPGDEVVEDVQARLGRRPVLERDVLGADQDGGGGQGEREGEVVAAPDLAVVEEGVPGH